jgi:lipopolysaccharide export system permease protein
MRRIGLTTIDFYIIRKFLGTFFFAILLIIFIAVIFDFSEKIDDFLENNAPLSGILFDYYLNFVPYFAVLFSPLFTFIAVIYFTSRMAYNTEIIAIITSGVSFHRLLIPYFISAVIITIFSFVLNNYVIPSANEKRLIFEENYYRNAPVYRKRNIHKQIEPGVFVYLENFNVSNNYGRKFSIEKFEDGKLVSKLISDDIVWDTTKNKWNIRNYFIRNYDDEHQSIITGWRIDTTINMHPQEFKRRKEAVQAMTLNDLNDFINIQKLQGATNIDELLIEKHRRFSFPFSSFILTLIGISVSSRKVKGGIGVHIGAGLLISFTYIFFMQFSAQFSISGAFPPFIAVWIPNIIFAVVAGFLYKLAPK